MSAAKIRPRLQYQICTDTSGYLRGCISSQDPGFYLFIGGEGWVRNPAIFFHLLRHLQHNRPQTRPVRRRLWSFNYELEKQQCGSSTHLGDSAGDIPLVDGGTSSLRDMVKSCPEPHLVRVTSGCAQQTRRARRPSSCSASDAAAAVEGEGAISGTSIPRDHSTTRLSKSIS